MLVATVWRFVTRTREWILLPAPMSRPRAKHASCGFKSKLFVFGGISPIPEGASVETQTAGEIKFGDVGEWKWLWFHGIFSEGVSLLQFDKFCIFRCQWPCPHLVKVRIISSAVSKTQTFGRTADAGWPHYYYCGPEYAIHFFFISTYFLSTPRLKSLTDWAHYYAHPQPETFSLSIHTVKIYAKCPIFTEFLPILSVLLVFKKLLILFLLFCLFY